MTGFPPSASRWFVRGLALVAVIMTIGCDRVTKRMAVETLAGLPGRSYLADTVRLEYAENTGGFLSLGAGLSPSGRTAIFVVVSGLMLAGIGVAVLRHRLDRWSMLGGALFFAGGASNWFDRVIHGRVVDFLNVGAGPLRTGIFNVADVAIMAGLGFVLLGQMRGQGSAAGPEDPNAMI